MWAALWVDVCFEYDLDIFTDIILFLNMLISLFSFLKKYCT